MKTNLNIDLQNIQIKHFTSQEDAFEEFCCQIFRNLGIENGWNNYAEFINKNGSSGDAGVESYWKFANGNEYCMQAKFSNELNNLWSQIDSSVTKALEKHTNLKKYYIFTPFDKTDQKQGKNDGQTKWLEYVKKWKTIKNIDFIWIGKSEILQELIKSNPYNVGIMKYWFDKVVFSQYWFKNHFEEVKHRANDRYSVNLNVKTSTKERFLLLAKTHSALKEYKKIFKRLKESFESLRYYNCFVKFKKEINLEENIENLLHIIKISLKTKEIISNNYTRDDFNKIASNISKLYTDPNYKAPLPENWAKCNRTPDFSEDKRQKEWDNYICETVKDFNKNLFCISNFINSTNSKNHFVFAKAGNGKTHLLCEIVNEMIQQDELISILVFGHYFYEKTLEESILNQLHDFQNLEELFSALDSYAKAKNQVAFFMIDGINEWEYCERNKIFSEIKLLKNKSDKYENIRLIISCRDEYKNDIFGNYSNYEKDFKIISHNGFLDNSINALHEFCDYYKIEIPSTPLLSPELSNPLILKTLCESFQEKGKFPKGINGVSTIFQSYLEYLNNNISNKLDLDSDDKIVSEVIERISKLIYENNGNIHIKKHVIKDAIKDIDNNPKWSNSILFNLEKCGLFVINKDYTYVSYDRYRDFLTAKILLQDINESKISNTQKLLKEKIEIFCKKSYMYQGLIDFLSIAVPEKWSFELISLYQNEKISNGFIDILTSAFYRSLPQRDIESINEHSLSYFEKLKKFCDNENYYWQSLISCATIENHPLNADYLHSKLKDLSMPDIDSDWTQFISDNYDNEFDEDYQNSNTYFSIKPLILPFLKINEVVFSDKTCELLATLFIWFTVSTNRILRDIATVATVNILRNKEFLALKIFEKFKNVKDIFLQERLYSIMYGITLLSSKKDQIKLIADTVFENVFNKEPVFPNILVRLSAYGIIDYSKYLGNSIDEYKNKFNPPYNYPIINEYPTLEDIEQSYCILPKENEPKELYSTRSILSSFKFIGDFGKYIVGNNLSDHWDNAPNRDKYFAWICKRAYDFGWNYERHGIFDYYINMDNSREQAYTERIGKKYQWLAYHEYLCNLMDNYQIKKGWQKIIFETPKMLDMIEYRRKNIDSSFIFTNKFELESYQTPKSWTHPNINDKLFESMTIENQINWLDETQDNICKGKYLLDVLAPDGRNKLVLNNFIMQSEQSYYGEEIESGYYRDFVIQIRSLICKQDKKESLVNKINEKFDSGTNGFCIYEDNNVPFGPSNQNILEYPWSSLYDKEINNIIMFPNEDKIENYNTIVKIARESSFYNDYSLYCPHPILISRLGLKIRKDKSYVWEDTYKNEIFLNSAINYNSTVHNVPIADKNNLLTLLKDTDISILFSVSVEKSLLPCDMYSNNLPRYHCMYYLTLYELSIDGKINELTHRSFKFN